MASGRTTIKQLRYDFYIASYNLQLKKRQAYLLASGGEKYPSKTRRYFIIEPSYSLEQNKSQDDFRLIFYKQNDTANDYRIGHKRKRDQIKERYHELDNEHYVAVNLPYPFVMYSPGSKELEAEYYIDIEGALRLTVIDKAILKHPRLKNIYTGELLEEVKDLRIAELY